MSASGALAQGSSAAGLPAAASASVATASQSAARAANTFWTWYGSSPSSRTAALAGPVSTPYAPIRAA